MTANSTLLLPIIALARAGAGERAWAMFREAGLENMDNDPAALTVKGRLLKDAAIAAKGAARRGLYRESANAYARAAKLNGATYPLINAATLSLLAGEREKSRKLARQVLQRIEAGDEAETPYWRAATVAEVQLLLGDVEKAKAALAEAMLRAPRAYEDHASTLRQFGLILRELRADAAWIEACRPPRALHFAGAIRTGADDARLVREIGDFLEREWIGFGYGALAAGADILIAEALLKRGAQLHIVLPAPAARFRETSVAPFGDSWPRRFNRVLKRAANVQSVGTLTGPLSPSAIRLAAEVAMGLAAMNASALMTEAVQLLALPPPSSRKHAGVSESARRIWKRSGRRQCILTAPDAASRLETPAAKTSDKTLAAFLCIEVPDVDRLPRIARALRAARPLAQPRWMGQRIEAAFATPVGAARAALSVAKALGAGAPAKIAGDYGAARRMTDPFGGPAAFTGAAAGLPGAIALSTPPGAIHVSENFAAALCAATGPERPRLELIGELPDRTAADPVKLFSLR